MQAELNGFFVNEVVNGVLFLVMVVLCVNTHFDRRIHGTSKDWYFFLFMLFGALYIGLMVVWLPLRDFAANDTLEFIVSAVRVLAAVLAYGFCALWIVSSAEMRVPMRANLPRLVFVMVAVLFVLSIILRAVTGSTLAANIPIVLYYLMLVILAFRYRKGIGLAYSALLTALIVIELLLQAQTWWNYTPANIFLVLGVMVLYSRMWLVQKQERIEGGRLLAEQRADLENARTKLVLSQIKPHFLFNTLSTIAYLCTKEPAMARDLCVDLASYLRSDLSALDSGATVWFSKELEHIEVYLRIEKVRFAEKLTVVYDVRDIDFKLPVLTIEPLVENAVKHGIRKCAKGGTVLIATSEEPDWHVVTVKDDGAGFDVEAFDENAGEHVGLRSVRRRIESLSQGKFSIESHIGAGTVATVRIPKTKG